MGSGDRRIAGEFLDASLTPGLMRDPVSKGKAESDMREYRCPPLASAHIQCDRA